MKKLILLFIIIVLSAAFYGCAANNKDTKDNTSKQSTEETLDETGEDTAEQTAEELVPNIGGIARGDSKEEVIKAFGKDYKETASEGADTLGEPFARMTYNNGVSVIVGTNSGKVLEIETTSADISTNLGFKIGDKAQDVLEAYEAKYKVPKSNQNNSNLVGWFLIKDQELVIFNFDKSGLLANTEVKPDSKIERIKISNFDYMD